MTRNTTELKNRLFTQNHHVDSKIKGFLDPRAIKIRSQAIEDAMKDTVYFNVLARYAVSYMASEEEKEKIFQFFLSVQSFNELREILLYGQGFCRPVEWWKQVIKKSFDSGEFQHSFQFISELWSSRMSTMNTYKKNARDVTRDCVHYIAERISFIDYHKMASKYTKEINAFHKTFIVAAYLKATEDNKAYIRRAHFRHELSLLTNSVFYDPYNIEDCVNTISYLNDMYKDNPYRLMESRNCLIPLAKILAKSIYTMMSSQNYDTHTICFEFLNGPAEYLFKEQSAFKNKAIEIETDNPTTDEQGM